MPLKSFSTRRGGRPLGGLISAFGSGLHGYHRGSLAFYPEPVDVWVAALTDAVPFYQRCMVVYSSTMSNERAKSLVARAREHLPSVHHAPLRRRVLGDSRPAELVASLREKGNVTTAVTSEVLPALVSPLENIPPQSLDLVVFAANVFGDEMLHDAPWHMSLAHRCLAPHGVVAIMGYATRVSVVAPEAARRDADDFMEDLQCTAVESAKQTESQEHRAALERALDTSSSLDVGHADMYFPFRSIKRRWFTSEYAATPVQLAAAYRALPEYQILSSETPRFRHLPSFGGGQAQLGEIVDQDEPVNVFRRHACVDPLEALEWCLQAQMMSSHGNSAPLLPPLRVHVRHFIITCSARSVNAASEPLQLHFPRRQLPQLN
ncbi:hypothetical protein TraAM80_04026 [Trypanosoma rangeli]|uniref:Methyltransferase type 11 domain-containing protein n=1 Tax=Trypanosoma rangeli TaxID=5698 RepID=A0A422NLY6_TRYRA|nr:uncharacterized protein TraAM80_04026 [Trypanosoma rangeli]RNF06520.1 hypothetical protein TraAM80_04026 [Trypanosoma rangeli]|eukprot:RNF06520.1 hypothetical protein TraAM80_04026 [Trypanosoma rangeli]